MDYKRTKEYLPRVHRTRQMDEDLRESYRTLEKCLFHEGRTVTPSFISKNNMLPFFQVVRKEEDTEGYSPVNVTALPPVLAQQPSRRCQKRMLVQNEDAPQCTAWTHEKELALCKGWVQVSKNSLVGNARKADGFWTKVLRNMFCGVYDNVMCREQVSGAEDEDYFTTALLDYEAVFGVPFTLHHCIGMLDTVGIEILFDKGVFGLTISVSFKELVSKVKGKEAEHDHLKVNKDDKGKGNVHDIQNRLGELEVDSARAIKARQVDDHDDDLDNLDLENRIKKLEEDFELKAKEAKKAKEAELKGNEAKKVNEAELKAKKAKEAMLAK
nr:hypothetical protein [Tanacetum cinerariifolium]